MLAGSCSRVPRGFESLRYETRLRTSSDNVRVPFTLAHGAAVLPFRGSRLVFPALLVGSFAPDFEYFFRLNPSGRFGHTLLGVFVLDLPLSLFVLWLYHSFVSLPVAKLLPTRFAHRLADPGKENIFGGVRGFTLIMISIFVGVMTHIAWDSLTHRNTWPYRHWRVLSQAVSLPILGSIPCYKVLQHGSTILGLAIFATWLLMRYWASPGPDPNFRSSTTSMRKVVITLAILGVATIGAVVRSLLVVGPPVGPSAEKQFVGVSVVTSIALIWWELVAYGVFLSCTSQRVGPARHETGV